MGGIVSAVGSILGGNAASKGAKQAANAQVAAANAAKDTELEMFYQNRTDLAPYRGAGTNALDMFMRSVTGKGFKFDEDRNVIEGEYVDVTDDERYSDFHKSPGYQFRLDEGRKTLENAASARGNLLSGATLKALTKYGQDYASGEYGNWLNQLGVLSGVGQTATNTTAQLGANAASNAGNYLMAAGDARASGYIGQANARVSTINGVTSAIQGQFGGGSMGGGGQGSFNMLAAANGLPWSDARLKRNIERVGEKEGFPIYEFSYMWSPRKRYRGVIAQDVARLQPEAVVFAGGFMTVNYAAIGLEMEEVTCH